MWSHNSFFPPNQIQCIIAKYFTYKLLQSLERSLKDLFYPALINTQFLSRIMHALTDLIPVEEELIQQPGQCQLWSRFQSDLPVQQLGACGQAPGPAFGSAKEGMTVNIWLCRTRSNSQVERWVISLKRECHTNTITTQGFGLQPATNVRMHRKSQHSCRICSTKLRTLTAGGEHDAILT